ncbi:GNAT family N-acetyltransferase [Trichocoleus sp. FACHB-591]|uniref:GNAT family N-acetyltransferase n=1 Tax=unclassified Trichocoleus TaxID=2628910 RepID=UPI0016871827|nr:MULTISPECIES: GNAT family N-acetyltransferase [unclassified Trichocoleus]MBD2094738.1 GNAT family N-acetyltransferase [Trichocoleus sp. FACHB-591]MBD2121850.1 GNAT family N-acetyltransferase [Trichocoleus sp. FACHB-262]
MEQENMIVRPAQWSDKTAVLNFCQHTWPDTEDYIAAVWDQWMTDSSGQILVATLKGQPVAMTRVVQLAKHEGWWEALRVDPQYRGRGLVRLLDPEIDRYFETRDITTVRCCVATWNRAMPDTVQRRGYQPVACYLKYSAAAIAAPMEQLSPLYESDFEAVWQWLQQSHESSPLFVCRGAKWQTLTLEQLHKRLGSGKVWGYWQSHQLQGLLIQSPLESADSTLWVGFIGGPVDDLPVVLRQMQYLAHHLQYSKVSGFFPKTNPLLTALEQAGYGAVAGGEFWVYEKQF